MTIDLISKLNTQIAKMDASVIEAHMAKGDLDEWVEDWRIEMASISLGLFALIYQISMANDPLLWTGSQEKETQDGKA